MGAFYQLSSPFPNDSSLFHVDIKQASTIAEVKLGKLSGKIYTSPLCERGMIHSIPNNSDICFFYLLNIAQLIFLQNLKADLEQKVTMRKVVNGMLQGWKWESIGTLDERGDYKCIEKMDRLMK